MMLLGIFGLSGEAWTAIGSIAGVVALPLAVFLARWNGRRGDDDAPAAEMPEEQPKEKPEEQPKIEPPRPERRLLPLTLQRITSGRVLLSLVGSALAYQLDHDDPESSDDVELIGNALTAFRDYGEIHDDIEPGDRVQVGFELTALIEELNAAGWVVYATKTDRSFHIAGEIETFPTAVIVIKREPDGKAAPLVHLAVTA